MLKTGCLFLIRVQRALMVLSGVLLSSFLYAQEQINPPQCTDKMAFLQQCTQELVSLRDENGLRDVDKHKKKNGQKNNEQRLKSSLKTSLGSRLKWHVGRGFVLGHQSYVKDYGRKSRGLGISRQVDDYTVGLTMTDPGISVRKRIKSLSFDARLATHEDNSGSEKPFAFIGVTGSWR